MNKLKKSGFPYENLSKTRQTDRQTALSVCLSACLSFFGGGVSDDLRRYGQIPKQPKPQKKKKEQNQGKISKNTKKLIKKTGPLKTVKPL